MMKLVLLFVVCFLAVSSEGQAASRYTETEYQTAFLTWQRSFNKAFTADEFISRFSNFKEIFDLIADQNAKNSSWKAGLNEWSSLSNAEFRRLLLVDLSKYPADRSPREFTGEEEGVSSRAATVDWRSKLPAVKNQGQCGSCWAFAATGATEGAWAIKTGRAPLSLSDQQLLDCASSGWTCNGGDPKGAMDYVRRIGGQQLSSAYPYRTARGACTYDPAKAAATVSATAYVAQNENALQNAVKVQPVVVCIDAGLRSFQIYKSGIYNDAACSASVLNHAVVAVGYGNDGAGDYWIVRNSWGTSWGIQGNFLLAKNTAANTNRCGVATRASFPSTTGTGNKI